MTTQSGPNKDTVRVAIIDDDDISRAGLAALLTSDEGFEIVASLDHDDALADPESWTSTADVAIVDAADIRRSDDQFPGAAVVSAIRCLRTTEQTTIVVITGHFFDDAVRRRMREAKADLFFHRTEVQNAARLRAIIADPAGVSAEVPEPLDAETMFRLGITGDTRVNHAVARAQTGLWTDEHGRTPGPRSRTWHRLRSGFNTVARLSPVNSDGRPPDRDQDAPSKPQIDRFLEWATRSKNER